MKPCVYCVYTVLYHTNQCTYHAAIAINGTCVYCVYTVLYHTNQCTHHDDVNGTLWLSCIHSTISYQSMHTPCCCKWNPVFIVYNSTISYQSMHMPCCYKWNPVFIVYNSTISYQSMHRPCCYSYKWNHMFIVYTQYYIIPINAQTMMM